MLSMLAMQTMSTITQSDPVVLLQADVKESVRRHLRVEAAKAGKTMGEILTDLLREHGGYAEPSEGDTAISENPRPSARPANKQRG